METILKNIIKENIEHIINICEQWIQNRDDVLYFIDPNDDCEISAHYGATHVAAAFIIWGKDTNNKELYNKGISLLDSILNRWSQNIKLPSFHFDFNNFALCLLEKFVNDQRAIKIRKILLSTKDSNHNTINWLPMRWSVNRKRLEWTGNNNYGAVIDKCKMMIADATNSDGGIEDCLPKGVSFNLQYDLATVAIMQYLRVQGETIDLRKQLGFLLNAVAPDGDINYQGRGTNQVFAWGLWVYLLASSGQETALEKALYYLSPRLVKMLQHKNIMLNEWEGEEKYLWWNYHYTSVYTAHCLLWLVMALHEYGSSPIEPIVVTTSETGLHINRNEYYFLCWFEGRTKYLIEKGPSLVCIWTKKYGFLCKGVFAPWQSPFGNKYIFEDVVLKNCCGLLSINRNYDIIGNRYLHRLFPMLIPTASMRLTPLFYPPSVEYKDGRLIVNWVVKKCNDLIFNLPTTLVDTHTALEVDGKSISINCIEAVRNQYGWVWLFQSHSFKARNIKFIIECI